MRRLLLLAAVLPRAAHPLEFEVSATTIGQGDQIRRFGADGVVLLSRRRVTQYLGLRVFELLPPPDPDSGDVVPRLQIVSQMRFDTDFGDYLDVRDADGVVVVPELEDDRLDLLLLYVDGRDFARGTLDFRAGRQVLVDPLDYFAFDGGQVFFHPPIHVGVEAFGGFEVKGARPLASPTLEIDGTSRHDLFDDEVEATAPTFGAAIRTHGMRDLFVRAGYRRTSSQADMLVTDSLGTQGPVRLDGVDEEKLAVTARGRVLDVAHPWGGARYNLLTGRLDLAEAGVRVALHPRHALTPAWSMAVPDFDGDSIFNLFSTEPWQDASLTWDFRALARLRGWARWFVRRYANEADGAMTETSDLHHGAGAGAELDLLRGFVRLDVRFDDGYGGRTAGADVSGGWDLTRDLVSIEGRLTALRFENDVRAETLRREMWSLGAQGGARYTPWDGVALHLLVEENTNQLYTSYFRVLAMLDLAYEPPLRTGAAP